jgi:hypothetical protein
MVNSLSVLYSPLLEPIENQSPRATRDRFAALLFAAALLQEALNLAQSLGKHFRHLTQYREEFAGLLGDKVVLELRSNLLKQTRNELIFHADREAYALGLSRITGDEIVLVSWGSPASGEIYFNISDDSLAAYLFGDANTDDEYLSRFGEYMEDISDVFIRFMRASHRLIPAALAQMGCIGKELDRAIGPR